MKRGCLGTTFNFVTVIYQQIAAVVSAFAIAALLQHFWHFEWRGFLIGVIQFWDSTVRPVTKWLLDNTIVALVKLIFHWKLPIPLLVRDYISAGVTVLFACVRAFSTRNTSPWDMLGEVVTLCGFYIRDILYIIFAWPIFLIRTTEAAAFQIVDYFRGTVRYHTDDNRPGFRIRLPSRTFTYFVHGGEDYFPALVTFFVMIVSPILYFAVIIALNQLVLGGA